MKIKGLVAGLLALAGVVQANGIEVGPGKYSSFSTDSGNAVVVGVKGLSANDFTEYDYFDAPCFVNESIVDGEKTAADDNDDYWCGPITDMNLLFLTGWASKTSYKTIDDMIDYFRANPKTLRYAKVPGDIDTVTEGTYGYKEQQFYDGIWRWFKATTKQDLSSSVVNSANNLSVADLDRLLGKGQYALHIDLLFYGDNSNPKWGDYIVSHSVTCCGYEKNNSDELTALYIIDSDNDQYVANGGGRKAPNSIIYCPVWWDSSEGMYAVEGIWGTTSYLLPGYTALKVFKDGVKSIKLDGNGGKVTPATVNLDVDEDETLYFPTLPVPPARSGFLFTGWATAKTGGEMVYSGDEYDASLFAGAKTPTLYAQWTKLYKVTLKDKTAWADWDWSEDQYELAELCDDLGVELDMSPDEKGVMMVPPGAVVYVEAPESSEGKNDANLVFQKWTVTPAKVQLGPDFRVTSCETSFIMPSENLTFQATYIDEYSCGRLTGDAYAASVCIGFDDVAGDYIWISPPESAFEWSPDGGKTWYKANVYDNNTGTDFTDGEIAMLKAGTYTITWRSTDPRWTTSAKDKVKLYYDDSWCVSATFYYTPQVVVDVATVDGDELVPSTVCGTATMNPKDGLIPSGKTVTLTAKAAKDYAFQGWVFAKDWERAPYSISKTLATWKLENYYWYDGMGSSSWLDSYIDPDDGLVHIVAVFKAIADYSADDLEFLSISTSQSGAYEVSDGSINLGAVVGCMVESWIDCNTVAFPLTYKLIGKLPDGLKFDAKNGLITGVPKKAGSFDFKVSITDPAKHSKELSVNILVKALPSWLAGDYRGDVDGMALCEMSVKSDGKVSAKIVSSSGTSSLSGSLTWRDPDADYSNYGYYNYDDVEDAPEYVFAASDSKGSYLEAEFFHNEASGMTSLLGWYHSYDYKTEIMIDGDVSAIRQNQKLLTVSDFLDKYYTFAFVPDETGLGYGYLTVKTDKKGGAKVTGQLPDGQKVSMSALVLPFVPYEDGQAMSDKPCAALYLFASPSAYKKLDWFSATLFIYPDGEISFYNEPTWTYLNRLMYGDDYCEYCGDEYESFTYQGFGAEYSAAKSLEDFYCSINCPNHGVMLEVAFKDGSETWYDSIEAVDFDGLFNVALKGDGKGSIVLESKSPAPWEEKETWKDPDTGKTYTDKWWNYWEDKKGNEITDPSQLSFSFAKATGIFTGKASVYFDYEVGEMQMQHKTVSLPYSGVIVKDGDEIRGACGYGAAIYTYKHTVEDECTGKKSSVSDIVSLPVTIEEP